MDRLFIARPDPAVVFIYGRGGVAVFVGGAEGQRPVEETDDHSRLYACLHPYLPRHLPAFGQPPYDLFYVLRHTDADRTRLRFFVSAWNALDARAVDRARRDSGWVLVGVRALPSARARFRYDDCRRAERLAALDERVRRALEQEHESGVAIRRVVPKSFPARKAVRVQRRRVCDAQLHPDARHDDPWIDRGQCVPQ